MMCVLISHDPKFFLSAWNVDETDWLIGTDITAHGWGKIMIVNNELDGKWLATLRSHKNIEEVDA